jgi:hypothetical protein
MSQINIARPGDLVSQFVQNCRGDFRSFRPGVSPSGRDVAFNRNTGNHELRQTSHNANAGLFSDCWTAWDSAIQAPYESQLVLFKDALTTGMVPLASSQPEAFGTLMYQWSVRKMSAGDWETAMFPGSDTPTNDTATYESASLPLPIDYTLLKTYIRTTEAGKRGVYGSGLGRIDIESDLMYDKGTGLARLKEAQLLNGILNKDGTAFVYNNNECYGYRTAPGRFRKKITTAWTDAAVTPELVRAEVYGWCKEFIPIVGERKELTLYINSSYVDKIDTPISTYSPDYTVRQWLVKVIPQLKEIKTAVMLPSDEVLLVHLAPSTVQIINGFAPTTLMWNSENRMEKNIFMMNMQIPLVKRKYFQETDTDGSLKTATYTTGILQALVGSVPTE